MSLGWMVAAMNVMPGELRPAERTVLLAHADDARKGSRRSSPDETRLIGVSGVGRSQVLAARTSLVRRGLIKQVERARLGHVAVYEFIGFDEDQSVYTSEATGELRPADRTQRARDASGPPDAPQYQEEITTQAAAAGDEIDQREGGEAADSVRELLALLGQRPDPESSWWTPAQAALARGGTPEQIATHVNHTPGARDPDRVRRVKLRDWPGTANGTSLAAARPLEHSEQLEQPPEPPPALRTGPPGGLTLTTLGDSIPGLRDRLRGPLGALETLSRPQANGQHEGQPDTPDTAKQAGTGPTGTDNGTDSATDTAALLAEFKARHSRQTAPARPDQPKRPAAPPPDPDDQPAPPLGQLEQQLRAMAARQGWAYIDGSEPDDAMKGRTR